MPSDGGQSFSFVQPFEHGRVSNMERTLVYGDTVFFKDREHSGFLTCKKRKLCMAVIEQLVPKAANNSPPEVKECCFTILPKLSYSHCQRLAKHLKANAAVPEQDWPDKVASKIANFRKLEKHESEQNAALILKMKGAAVTFGVTTMLYHIKSNSFLTLVKEGADKDKKALKLVLADEGCKSAWFDLLPGFKTSRLGDSIPFNSIIALRNTKNDVTVNVADDTPTGMAGTHEYMEKVHEVNCFVNATVFEMVPYKEPAKEDFDLLLSSGDIVTLYHADSDSYLVCRDKRYPLAL